MKLTVGNGRIATASGVLDGATLRIEGERITAIEPGRAGRPDLDLDGGWLLPGFIDTQNNGGGGVLFNDETSVEGIRAIGAAHAAFGTTAFLPTLISDSPDKITQALDAVDRAIETGVPGVVGVHIEGPFINEARRGIHEARRIRRIDPAMVALLAAPRRGKVVVTLAPELCAPEDIAALARAGVLVCGGHSDASHDEAVTAFAAGMRGVTHLFNAMSPLRHRAPGLAGAALDAADIWCGLIVDGVHLHPAVVRLAIGAKGVGRIMLVTDAMPSVGTDATTFMLQGKRIGVVDGVCTYEDGTLAGSDLDMAAAVRNCVAMTGRDPAAVAVMASGTPAAFLEIEASHGAIAPGLRADFAWLDRDLRPRGTWIGGIEQQGAARLQAAE